MLGSAAVRTDGRAQAAAAQRRRRRPGAATATCPSRTSSDTAAPPDTGPSTPSAPTSTPSTSAPTSSSRTWCPPRTGIWCAVTRTTSRPPRTSPTTPSSRPARPPRASTGPPSPAGSPRTSPSPSSRRCAPRSASRATASTTRSTTAAGTSPPSRRCCAGREEQGRRLGRRIWLHSETKHPTYFRGHRTAPGGPARDAAAPLRAPPRRLPAVPRVLRAQQHPAPGEAGRHPVPWCCSSNAGTKPWDFVVSGDPRTVDDLVKPEGLRWIASYAQGIGPTLDLIIPKDAAGKLTRPTTLVRDAHAQGLILHPYTMRNENTFLPADFRRGTRPQRLRRRVRRLQDVLRDRHRRGVLRQRRTPRCSPAADFASGTSVAELHPVRVTSVRRGNRASAGGRVPPGMDLVTELSPLARRRGRGRGTAVPVSTPPISNRPSG